MVSKGWDRYSQFHVVRGPCAGCWNTHSQLKKMVARFSKSRVVLHIGFHKTGTTSIQRVLNENRDKLLADSDVAFYSGYHNPANHLELHVAAMRPERQSPFKQAYRFVPTAAYISNVRERVARLLSRRSRVACFSAEGLSLLRHEDEVESLSRIFDNHAVEVIAYLRNREDWVASYAAMLARQAPSTAPVEDSYANLTEDSWLLNFERRIDPFRAVFGRDQVRVIQYDEVLACDGSVIPSFFRAIGAEKTLAKADWEDVWLNRRSPPH